MRFLTYGKAPTKVVDRSQGATMRAMFGVLGRMTLIACGLLSMVTFTITSLAHGSIGFLILGWFVAPITTLVWPALSGSAWMLWFYVALIVGGGLGYLAESGEGASAY